MNNADFQKKLVNNIVLDGFMICKKIRQVQVIRKLPHSYS